MDIDRVAALTMETILRNGMLPVCALIIIFTVRALKRKGWFVKPVAFIRRHQFFFKCVGSLSLCFVIGVSVYVLTNEALWGLLQISMDLIKQAFDTSAGPSGGGAQMILAIVAIPMFICRGLVTAVCIFICIYSLIGLVKLWPFSYKAGRN